MKKRVLYLFLLFPILGFSQIFSENWDGNGQGIDAWTLINNDGLTVNEGVAFITDAWTVVDLLGDQNFGGPAGNFAAASTSWYDVPGISDDYLISPAINLTDETSATLVWDSKAQDPEFSDGYELRLSPTGGNNIADFTVSLFTIDAENSEWTTRTVNLTPYIGSNVRFAFINNSNDKYILLIDNISVVSCAAPLDGMLVSATTTSATVSWSGSATSFDIEYGPAGFALGSGMAATSLTNQAVISSLTNATSYDFYVRSDCGDSESDWAGPFTFLTNCESVNVPYAENFESAVPPEFPACTSGSNMGGNPWATVTGDQYGFTGTKLRYTWNVEEAANAWFYTRGLNLTADQSYTITYDYGATGTTFPESLKVAYGTSATATGMVNTLADYPVVNNALPLTASVSFTPTTTGVYYFGFNAYSAADQFYLFVDNIIIEETSLCASVTGLLASGVNDDSATITWNAVDSAAGYEYVLDQVAADPAGSGTLTTDLNYIASPLDPETTYYFHIRSACDGELFSSWRTISFTTNPLSPVNDDCDGALPLVAGGVFADNAVLTNSTAATINPNDDAPSCLFVDSGNDIWFTVAVPASGSVTVETAADGAPLDTVLELYTGTCGDLTSISCNDDIDGINNRYSSVTATGLPEGTIVYARAWGFGVTVGSFAISAFDASLGTDAFADGKFAAYPIPVKTVLNLSFERNISNVAMYNLIGQEVIVKNVNATQSEIDMSALASGTYILKVTADNQVKTIKVIKE